MEGFQTLPVSFCHGPRFCPIQQNGQYDGLIKSDLVLSPYTVQSNLLKAEFALPKRVLVSLSQLPVLVTITVYSYSFHIISGVRQGGLLSPVLFAIYIMGAGPGGPWPTQYLS